MAKQKSKKRLSIFEKLRRLFMKFGAKQEARLMTRHHRKFLNGWKGLCATKSQIRRIGSRKRAIEVGLIKA